MKELSTEVVDKLGDETYQLFKDTYWKMSESSSRPVPIEDFYNTFRTKWLEEMYSLLNHNAEGWDIDLTELTTENVDEKMKEWGFPIPSYQKIYSVLHAGKMTYMSPHGENIIPPVVNVW